MKWTTIDEINFIRNLGSQSKMKKDKKILVKKYRESFYRRSRWGELDVEKILEAIDRETGED